MQSILDVLLEMPDKDTSSLAERQREIHYSHAHLFAMNMIRSPDTLLTLANDTEFTRRIIILISKLPTHRYQKGDSVLLAYAKISMSHHSGLHTGWDLMLL